MNAITKTFRWIVRDLKKIPQTLSDPFFWKMVYYCAVGMFISFTFIVTPINMIVDAAVAINTKNAKIEQLEKDIKGLKADVEARDAVIAQDGKNKDKFELVLQDYGDFIVAFNKNDQEGKDRAGRMITYDKNDLYAELKLRDYMVENLPDSQDFSLEDIWQK